MSFSRPVGGVLESEIARSYNSFAGADYKAQIGQFTFAQLQGVSYSITREKAPIYTMGSPDPRAYARNKRGIAGSLVWVGHLRLARSSSDQVNPSPRPPGPSPLHCHFDSLKAINPLYPRTPARVRPRPGKSPVLAHM
jgi:hypothetical protein